MKRKNIISCLCALTLIISLLTGCGAAAEADTPQPPHPTVETVHMQDPPAPVPMEDAAPVSTEEAAPVLPEVLSARTEYSDTVILGADEEPLTQEAEQTNLRPSYDAGNCYKLEGNPYVITIFLDDDVSSWPEDKVLTYLRELVIPGLDFIEENAARWDKELEFSYGYYASYGHPDRPVRYNGVVKTFADGTTSQDILEQAALSLGFESAQHMNERLQDYSGQDQIVYLVMLNKGGHSYSSCYRRSRYSVEHRDQALEKAVIFTGFTDDSGDTASDTVAHETLHMFGAQDYYMPDSRKALASVLYPEDIMLCAMPDLEFFTLGELTAYSVGWHDDAPEVLKDPDWWGQPNN